MVEITVKKAINFDKDAKPTIQLSIQIIHIIKSNAEKTLFNTQALCKIL